MKELCAVILAAGFSKRLGFNKLTLKIDGEPIIRRAVSPFLEAGIGKVYVVTGPSSGALKEGLAGLTVEFVENRENACGMGTSARAALPYIKESKGVFFHLGDKPFPDKEMITEMAGLFRENGEKIIVPVFEGHKGHPVLMDVKPYIEEIKGLAGDKGLREIIENHRENVLFIEGNEGSLFDVDTEEEITILRTRGYKIEKGES